MPKRADLASVRQQLARLLREVERLAKPPRAHGRAAPPATRRQILMRFGANLRAARLAAGLTQDELARDATISNNHLSLLENGRRSPSLLFLVRLAGAADVPLERLLKGLVGRVGRRR